MKIYDVLYCSRTCQYLGSLDNAVASRAVLESLLNAYNSSGYAGRFVAITDSGMTHVIPAVSEAEHIRRAIASYVSDKSVPDAGRIDHPLLEMIGMCDAPSGPRDAAVHHDAYLYGRRR